MQTLPNQKRDKNLPRCSATASPGIPIRLIPASDTEGWWKEDEIQNDSFSI